MQSDKTAMKNIIFNQKAERDELMARPYQQRQTKHDVEGASRQSADQVDYGAS